MDLPQLLDRLAAVRAENQLMFDAPFVNALSMREFGNKTHGDMLEIAFVELINSELFPDINARHVGKERYRADGAEEDVLAWFVQTPEDGLDLSLKAYGSGDLQLATNSSGSMSLLLTRLVGDDPNVSTTVDQDLIVRILESAPFAEFRENTNTLAAIYTEQEFNIASLRELADFNTDGMGKRELQSRLAQQGIEPLTRSFQIMSFNTAVAFDAVVQIRYELGEGGRGIPRPRWRFYDIDGVRIMEVRYGRAGANALQRGLWTHTVNANEYFRIVTPPTNFQLAHNFLDSVRQLLTTPDDELE
jgi:hypothetical protein